MGLSELAGRDVLVTGGTGFIGANLCAALSGAGARVTATSRQAQAEAPGITWRVADLARPENAAALIEESRPEFVFHLAGYVTGGRDLEHVLPALEANCVAAVNLMTAAAARPGVRVVLANSLEEPSEEEAGAPPV